MSCTHRLTVVTLLSALVLTGCFQESRRSGKSDNTQVGQSTDPGSAKQFVDQAFTFIKDLDRYPAESPQAYRVQAEVLTGLNRWLMPQEFDRQWQPDPMIADLPEAIRALPRMQDLASRPFLPAPPALAQVTYRGSEYDFIVGSFWAKKISEWVKDHWNEGEQKLSPEMKQFFEAQKDQTLTPEQTDQLTLAYLLFDWTVRHIQPVRDEAIVRKTFKDGTSRDFWRALQIMQGDAQERARVFIHLCRQAGLDAVAVQFGESDPVTQVVAVLVGKDLYLFDTAYGLPVATADGTGIQTLSNLVEHPEALSAMSTKDYTYPVTPDKLKQAILLVEAPSTSLTQATDMLEQVLIGEDKIVLHVRPSFIKDRMQKIPGVTDVRLWSVPLEAEMALPKWLSDPELIKQLRSERSLYDAPGIISMGRTLQLMCRLETETQRPGARKIFLEGRDFARKLRNATPTEKEGILKAMGLDFGNDTQARDAYLQFMQQNAELWRELASFNLGVMALGAEEYPSALDFFEKRTLEPYPETTLKSAAQYGIARSYEALSKQEDADPKYVEQAIEFYTDDDDVLSPYRRGNVLRAERLMPPKEEAETDPAEADPSDAQPEEAAPKPAEEDDPA